MKRKWEIFIIDELERYHVSAIEELTEKNLNQFRGELVRDYRKSQTMVSEKREIVLQKLESMRFTEIYQDEFFRKPLESLKTLVENPVEVKEQVSIIVDSYHAQLEKLAFDLSMVEKEKAKLLEMLFDYVEDVHTNLNRIDRNSTITVRNRSIKMLRLKLSDWEEQKNIFEVRLKNFMETLKNRAMDVICENGNLQELLGNSITTKNLYHSVVGIGTIQIRLYKIESDREYPISWKEVARNSGGEGFLSAFVVLESLLSYMRRDETDIFGEREEGKVLVMDNPFAQTNAAHLLKPLMDIAKKSNTQLICLSGESIYSRFDNIYALNFVVSGLRKEMK